MTATNTQPEIECTRTRACKWQGTSDDLVRKPNLRASKNHGIKIRDLVCPRCGCKTMYDIKK